MPSVGRKGRGYPAGEAAGRELSTVLGLVWIGLRQRRGVDERRSERKTGNEYERGYFREDLAAVRAHHRRCFRAPHKTKGMREPDPRRGKCHGDGAGKKHETEREK